eukprot:scaffold1690_cov182-Amphora_coffeaeformis.AAC.56
MVGVSIFRSHCIMILLSLLFISQASGFAPLRRSTNLSYRRVSSSSSSQLASTVPSKTTTTLYAKNKGSKKKKNSTVASGSSGFSRAAGKWDGCESLRTWLRTNGAKIEGLHVGSVGQGNLRGVMAARDFQRGEVLFSVPRETCIVDEAKADKSPMADLIYPSSFDRNKLPPPIRVALMLLWLERSPSNKATWEPALLAFPSVADFEKDGGPMELWSEDEVEQVECGQIIVQVYNRKEDLRALYKERILPRWVAAAKEDTVLSGIPPPSLREFQHAVCVVTSRNFGQGATNEGSSSMLVPGVDLCNHDDPKMVNTRHSLSPQGNFLVVATKSIAAGDEVLVSYGPLPNHLLLAQFGFMLLDREIPLVSDTALVRMDGLFFSASGNDDDDEEKKEQQYVPVTVASEAAADVLWEQQQGPGSIQLLLQNHLQGCHGRRSGRISRWQTASTARAAANLVAKGDGKALYRGLLERELASYSCTLAQDEAKLANHHHLLVEDDEGEGDSTSSFSIHSLLALRFRIHCKRMLENELKILLEEPS